MYFACISSYAQTHIITLGKGENCTGFNLCAVQEFDKTTRLAHNQAVAVISLTKENHVLIAFQKNKLNDALFLKYFSTGQFVLDGDFKLPPTLAEKLKISFLKRGGYKVTATADSYEVVF